MLLGIVSILSYFNSHAISLIWFEEQTFLEIRKLPGGEVLQVLQLLVVRVEAMIN